MTDNDGYQSSHKVGTEEIGITTRRWAEGDESAQRRGPNPATDDRERREVHARVRRSGGKSASWAERATAAGAPRKTLRL
jgi:hypothetical protein